MASQVLLYGQPEVDPGETKLFAAMQTCAYRSSRRENGTRIRSCDRRRWADRWNVLRAYLVERNLGLAYSMMDRFHGHDLDWDELRSEALLALLRSVEGFNPWRGFRFSTYACNAITRSLVHASRKAKRYRAQFPVEHESWREPIPRTDTWSDLFADRLHHVLRENQGELTDREAMILSWRFPMDGRLGMTLGEVGDAMGLSKERVRQIQKSALGKLREVLAADPSLQ
jgi:RNA polymerase primary sigma factor